MYEKYNNLRPKVVAKSKIRAMNDIDTNGDTGVQFQDFLKHYHESRQNNKKRKLYEKEVRENGIVAV